jgi:uncharacterized protein (TIGR03437 family)
MKRCASLILAVSLLALTAIAQTGTPVPALSALDSIMQQALARYNVKGGALAIVKDGHLVFARGYGWADAEAQQPVQPDSLFRWCSISKTVTAAAAMRLVEEGKLDLDASIFTILNQYAPYNGKLGDSRLTAITVRQVLQHTGGWDRAISPQYDPVVGEGSLKISQTTGAPFPPSADDVIRYMLAQRLDFAPGSRFAYSNFGYVLIGRVIEKIGGQTYDAFVRKKVLDPSGLPHVQKGSSVLAGRLPSEAKYYDYPGAPLINSYLSPAREMVPAPYGLLNCELGAPAGAWVGSAIDLAKFVAMLDGARAPALVSAGSFSQMLAQSQPPIWVDVFGWYGFGLFVQRQPDGINWDHGGYSPGSQGYFYRFANGLGYAVLFNGASQDGAYPIGYVGQAVWDAMAAVRDWPDHDLFPQYYPPRIGEVGVVNAASFRPGALAPDSLATILGVDLGGRSADPAVSLRDSGGMERPVQVLYSGPGQLNIVLPGDAVPGDASVLVRREGFPDAVAALPVTAVSPGVFTLNEAGLAAASLVRGKVWEPVFQIDGDGKVIAKPIAFGPESEDLTLVLYCTGVRGRSALTAVTVSLGDRKLAAFYAGSQVQYAGLDQINVSLPRNLAGAGEIPVTVEVDGATSNTASLAFR